jgi:hypothetical protein
MNPSTLERIRSAISAELTDLGERSVRAFLALPGLANWCPLDFTMPTLSAILDNGLPLALLGDSPTSEKRTRAIARWLSRNSFSPHPCHEDLPVGSQWSEIQAGALLTYIGAAVAFIDPPSDSHGVKNPDIRITVGQNVVDVEVTAAESRRSRAAIEKGPTDLSGAILATDHDWHILALFADASNQTSLEECLSAVLQLQPGESQQCKDHWFVKAFQPEQRDAVVAGNVAELHGPEWWPKGVPHALAIQTLIGPRFSPYVKFASLYPKDAYINPIKNKADDPQCDPNHPFLVAVDVSQLPGAHSRLPTEIAEHWSIWSHVSGVLLFEYRPWFGFETKQWEVSLHLNPYPTKELPPALAASWLADSAQHSIKFRLSEHHKQLN